jgi:quinol monooxygenase YgiN
MVIEFLSIYATPGRTADLATALTSLLGPLQVQPGCLSCRMAQTWPSPSGMQMEVRWNTMDDLMRHLQSDHGKQLLRLMELSIRPPVLEFVEVAEIRGLDLVADARRTLQ